MVERNGTTRHRDQPVDAGGPGPWDQVADAYDAWQRSSERLLALERSLATRQSVDPDVEALIKEVKVLRSCTVELFVHASGSLGKLPLRPPDPAARTAGAKRSGTPPVSTSYRDPSQVRT